MNAVMQIVSVNVGARQVLSGRSFNGETGIFKRPATGRVRVSELGLAGDQVVDTRHHGGADQAVYLYRQEDYDWWGAELGEALAPGTFGDNLTVSGLPEPGAVVGSRLVFDTVVLEITAPRIPCNILAQRMNDPGFARRFMRAERPGLYCRVIQGGELGAGDVFTLADFVGEPVGEPVTTLEIFRAAHRRLDGDELRRFLAAPIDIRTRRDFEAKLAAL